MEKLNANRNANMTEENRKEKNKDVKEWAGERLKVEFNKERAYRDFGDDIFYKELICAIFQNQRVELVFPDMEENIAKIVELKCYKILKQIRNVITNDNLSDESCFLKIEEILEIFNENGIFTGTRHDF